MRRLAPYLRWYYVTRSVAIVLIVYAVGFEKDPGNRGTSITAAIGLIAAEPVGRRERGEK
jgi:hypothetical protein